MQDAGNRREVGELVQARPPLPTKTADPPGRRGDRERDQHHQCGHSDGDVGTLHDILPHLHDVEELVEDKPGREVQHRVEEAEEPEQPPEPVRRGPPRHLPQRCDRQREHEQQQRVPARLVRDVLDRVRGEVTAREDEVREPGGRHECGRPDETLERRDQ